MASTHYFDNFPNILYNGSQCKDISKRVKVVSSAFATPYAFRPYTLKHRNRPDQIAYKYYNDPFCSWLVFESNKVVDPYYDWHMTDIDFNNYITSKYGNYGNAQLQILYWQNNWFLNQNNISVAAYSAFTQDIQKYWNPVLGAGNSIVAYTRKQEDWQINTNAYADLSIHLTANSSFVNGEYISVTSYGNTGTAQILSANVTDLIIQHILLPNVDSNSIIVGITSNTICNAVSMNVISYNIPPAEAPYWVPVTSFDWETNRNSNNLNIQLLDNQFLSQATKEFVQKMKQ